MVRALLSRRMIIVALAALALVPFAVDARQRSQAEPPAKIEITAQPFDDFDLRDPSRRRFGSLQFRGGLVLNSSHKDFGGISGLHVAADGVRFVAVTDKGNWLRGRLTYREGKPAGIADAEMAPMLASDGKPLAARGWYDTEALAEDGGMLYVGIERTHRIVRFDYGKSGPKARGRAIDVPADLRRLPSNKGIEGLIKVPKGQPLAGTLIAFSERGLDAQGDLLAFLIGGRTPGAFSLKRSEGFDVSDAVLLPGGDVLVLERKYSPLTGVAIRMRRLMQAQIKPGALVDGPVMFGADMGHQVDNMEALAVHRDAAGPIVLTMISDDNFSALQRTLLLQFTLIDE